MGHFDPTEDFGIELLPLNYKKNMKSVLVVETVMQHLPFYG